jgi:hypothetical protein
MPVQPACIQPLDWTIEANTKFVHEAVHGEKAQLGGKLRTNKAVPQRMADCQNKVVNYHVNYLRRFRKLSLNIDKV